MARIGLLCKQIKNEMRYLIPFLFLATTATAQTITFDTLYFERVDGQLFQITRTEFENGSYSQTRYAADSAEVLKLYANEIEREAAKLAEAARQTVTIPAFSAQSIRRNNILNTQIGARPIIDIQNRYEGQFLETASNTVWQLRSPDNSVQEVVFSKTATGQLIYKVGEEPNKPAILFGQIMRLNNYPQSGQTLFLFQLRDRVWQDIDGEYLLRLVNPQRR
jgi:hypothetical protein